MSQGRINKFQKVGSEFLSYRPRWRCLSLDRQVIDTTMPHVKSSSGVPGNTQEQSIYPTIGFRVLVHARAATNKFRADVFGLPHTPGWRGFESRQVHKACQLILALPSGEETWHALWACSSVVEHLFQAKTCPVKIWRRIGSARSRLRP